MHFALWLLLSLFLAHGDEGAGLDPHGGRRFTARSDAGSAMDPNGGRVGALAGVIIDPNG